MLLKDISIYGKDALACANTIITRARHPPPASPPPSSSTPPNATCDGMLTPSKGIEALDSLFPPGFGSRVEKVAFCRELLRENTSDVPLEFQAEYLDGPIQAPDDDIIDFINDMINKIAEAASDFSDSHFTKGNQVRRSTRIKKAPSSLADMVNPTGLGSRSNSAKSGAIGLK